VATDVVVKKARYVPGNNGCGGPAAGSCGSAGPCNNGCGSAARAGAGNGCGAPCGNAGTACGTTCGTTGCSPICSSGLGGGLRGLLNDPCRPKPIRDFFSGLCANRLACDPCPPTHCGDPCANPCK
jgi:hypothetical protein